MSCALYPFKTSPLFLKLCKFLQSQLCDYSHWIISMKTGPSSNSSMPTSCLINLAPMVVPGHISPNLSYLCIYSIFFLSVIILFTSIISSGNSSRYTPPSMWKVATQVLLNLSHLTLFSFVHNYHEENNCDNLPFTSWFCKSACSLSASFASGRKDSVVSLSLWLKASKSVNILVSHFCMLSSLITFSIARQSELHTIWSYQWLA